MYIIWGLIFVGAGLGALLNPRKYFEVNESFKSFIKRSTTGPTKMYLVCTRIGGAILIPVGLYTIYLHFTV